MKKYSAVHGSETEALIHAAKLEWETTVDLMPDSIAIIDREYNIIRLNRTMRDTIGATSYHDVIGRKCFSCVDLCNAPPSYCPHKKLLLDHKEHKVEIYNEKFGGHCEIVVIPYFNPAGALLGSIHIMRDINQRVREQKEKDHLLSRRLQSQKLESVGQLASGIAHEINTPSQFIATNVAFLEDSYQELFSLLSSVLVLAQQLEEGEAKNRLLHYFEEADWQFLSEEIPAALEQTHEGIDRISTIVRAMKEFSHPGSKSKVPTDLNHLIENTVTIARNEWKYVSNVDLELYEELPEVSCIPDEMGQVLLNLLVNAAHAIAEKIGDNPEGEKGAITISTRLGDKGINIMVRDTGAGIPESAQNRIFDPFYTTKKIGKGTGQGLAIVYDVVAKKHGGSITFTTKKGQGTEFMIWLPLADESEKEQ